MKNLKNKILWTLIILLSLFLLTILIIFNVQNYAREKQIVENALTRLNINVKKDENINEEFKPKDNFTLSEENRNKIFMDTIVYTVLLNSNDDIIEVISHYIDNQNTDEIKLVTSAIIEENSNDIISIGNLFVSRISYSYKKGEYLVIVDNINANTRLVKNLEISLILFITLELVIILLAKILTKWIIRPAEESFKNQKQFIADASHELKTPLSVIMASAEALENDSNEKKWLRNIESESERMSKLITNLLDLAKLDKEDATPTFERINMSKLTEMSILTLESLMYEKEIRLKYDIEDKIFLNCNAEEIKQLLSVLLDNAIKHSAKKGSINVTLKSANDNITLNITNKGDAIPKGEEEKIFERFYRVDSSRNRDDNRYGLGLAIAKAIVLKHKGKITASSNKGYTTFTVTFKKN